MYKEFDYEHGIRRKKLFLDYAVNVVKSLFNEYCSQLKVEAFLHFCTRTIMKIVTKSSKEENHVLMHGTFIDFSALNV